MGYAEWVRNTNLKIARSNVGHYFRLDGSGHVSSSDVPQWKEFQKPD